MGVSGSGKTTIGKKLAGKLQLPFYDADDFHPKSNIKKMESAIPLDDRDRKPWLELLAEKMLTWENNGGAVLACSALKESYRKLLDQNPKVHVRFIYLKGSKELIADRIRNRDSHFMPEELLQSQFDALEEPENAIVINIDTDPDELADRIVSYYSK